MLRDALDILRRRELLRPRTGALRPVKLALMGLEGGLETVGSEFGSGWPKCPNRRGPRHFLKGESCDSHHHPLVLEPYQGENHLFA